MPPSRWRTFRPPSGGEVLLNRRLGIAPPTASNSLVPREILDALRTGTLLSSEVEGLNALFLGLSVFWLIHLCNIGP